MTTKPPSPQKVGRPSKLTRAQVAYAKVLLAGGQMTFKDVAARMGVHRTTLYDAFHAAGIAIPKR